MDISFEWIGKARNTHLPPTLLFWGKKKMGTSELGALKTSFSKEAITNREPKSGAGIGKNKSKQNRNKS